MKGIVVVTSHSGPADAKHPTGFWLEEVTHFYTGMTSVGCDLVFVSPLGGVPPQDQRSGKETDEANRAFLGDAKARAGLLNSRRPDEVDEREADFIYFAGGHGAMWDFAENRELGELGARIYERGGYVVTVCHGGAVLMNMRTSSGRYLVEEREVSCFTNVEETLVGMRRTVPFLLESELRERGAKIRKGIPLMPCVAVSDRLVTGQNPASTSRVAQEFSALLKRDGRLGKPEAGKTAGRISP